MDGPLQRKESTLAREMWRKPCMSLNCYQVCVISRWCDCKKRRVDCSFSAWLVDAFLGPVVENLVMGSCVRFCVFEKGAKFASLEI